MKKKNIQKFLKKYKAFVIAFFSVIIALTVGILVTFNAKERTAISTKTKEEKMVANTNEGIIKEEVYEGLKFTNISLISENGYGTFTATVTNTSDSTSDIVDVNIVLKDGDGNEIITLRGNIGSDLKSGESRTITASTNGSLKDAKVKSITAYE